MKTRTNIGKNPAGSFIAAFTQTVSHALDSVGYSGNISIDPVFNSIGSQITQRPQKYFYHYNHQGSVALVTWQNGTIRQHLQYLPYGGTFVDHRTGTYSSTYTFSAKEKDSESGYTYFGARYYSDNIMQWLSVDPMSDKYPSMSPYMYCAGNPIGLKDPNGEDFDPKIDHEKKTITINAVYYTATQNKAKLQNAIDVWNKQSGNYYFQPEGSSDKYTINFDLKIAEGNYATNQDATDAAFNKNWSNIENVYKIESILSDYDNMPIYDANGITLQNNQMSILPNAPNITRTSAHEIGHTLGIDEMSRGLMKSGGYSSMIYPEHIANILKTAGINVSNYPNVSSVSTEQHNVSSKNINMQGMLYEK